MDDNQNSEEPEQQPSPQTPQEQNNQEPENKNLVPSSQNLDERRPQGAQPLQQVLRVRLPRKTEVLGIVESRLGYGKSRVICQDQKTRICRIPGGMRRHLWVRPQNIVLVRLWEIGGDAKGDIIHQYSQAEVDWLKRKGFLKNV